MLVSFQLASKNPESLIELFDNLEQMAVDPSCFEVLVKADIEDQRTQAVLRAEAAKRKFRLVAMVTPRRGGYEDLWQALNELFALTDPSAYFVCNINDEVRIQPHGWDERLRRYQGLFPDHIFRLRTSKLKLRNYYDFWECGFAPENYAFFTKRWLDICGDWNPCFGPDSSQQYIAYYLGYANKYSIKQYNRDVPILDISWQNEGVSRNLSAPEIRRRTATNFRLWGRQVSHPMQEELFRRGRLLQANIIQAEMSVHCPIDIIDDRNRRTLLLKDRTDGALLDLLPYKINRLRHTLRNLRRYCHYTYFAGGGREASNLMPISIAEYLMWRYPTIRIFCERASPLRFYRSARNAISAFFSSLTYVSKAFMASLFSALQTMSSLARDYIAHYPFARPLVRAMRTIGYSLVWPARAFYKFWRDITDRLTSAVQAKNAKTRHASGRDRILLFPVRLTFRAINTVYGIACSTARMINRSAEALFSFHGWRFIGKRLSLALTDRDHRWLTIDESARQRIAPTHDPWFDPPQGDLEHQLARTAKLNTVSPASLDPVLLTSADAVQPANPRQHAPADR